MKRNKSVYIFAIVISLLVVGILFAQETGILVLPNGNVGIGTENPTSALEVNGRIKDKTGFVMPVGTILPYGGASAPDGWLLCNGADISRTTYADLFAVIGTIYGAGNGSSTFNIPDLRGIFLRGAGTSGKLSNANGNPFTGTLGTYQNDKMQGHVHQTSLYYPGKQSGGVGWPSGGNGTQTRNITSPITDGSNGDPRTGDETNPANLAVNYIIKY
jgi:hypothetical protein